MLRTRSYGGILTISLRRTLVLEGPDGGGKTTLGNALADLGLVVHHAGGPGRDADDLKERCRFIIAHSREFVYDRTTAISERVYGRIRESGLMLPEDYLDRVLMALDPIVVYCRPPMEALHAVELAARPHKSLAHVREVVANRTRIIDAYDDLISDLSLRRLIVPVFYDRTRPRAMERVIEALRGEAF